MEQQQMSPQQPNAPMGALPQAASVVHEITHGPSFALLRVELQPGQRLAAEAGAMVARASHLQMDVKMSTKESVGFFAMAFTILIAIVRKILGGESFFVNHFYGTQRGSVWLAPTMAGQIAHRRINPGEKLILTSGAYLASVGNIDVNVKFAGFMAMFAKEGSFMLEVTGDGDLWFNSYGGLRQVEVNGPFMVDDGHLVAYEGQLTTQLRSAGGGMLGFVAGGEGWVREFNGQGKVYLQSRNEDALVAWLTPMLPRS